MPKVKVQGQSSTSAEETFKKVSNWLGSDDSLKSLDPHYEWQPKPDQLRGSAKGKMFKASLAVSSQGAGSLVDIEVDLPMALALIKGKVQRKLQEKVDEVLS